MKTCYSTLPPIKAMRSSRLSCRPALHITCILPFALCCASALAQEDLKQPLHPAKSSASKSPAQSKSLSPDDELQQAIGSANNDRATLVRNLEAYLKKYPDSPKRSQIYRALVEATLQLRDTVRAADYAERIVALSPDDISIALLAVQLLERTGDQAALRRAANYSSRVLEFVDHSSSQEKSPRVSQEDWQAETERDKMTVLLLRGRLLMKLHDNLAAQKDFEAADALVPSAISAEKLGEIAELDKNLNEAIKQYARAFALADAASGSASRREVRQKLGNVWRLAHGSEDGLGDYFLHAYDDASAAGLAKTKRNATAKEPYDFSLRKAADSSAYPLASLRGKIVVLNFWATWCGPCRALEPHFERIAAQFQQNVDVLFLAVNCDEDETLVAPYLKEEKLKTTVVFADGLELFLAVSSYPTTVILDRSGKIAYRTDGFDPDTVDNDLTDAVTRVLAN